MTHSGVAADGNTIYFAGGVVGTDAGEKINAVVNTWKYDVTTNTWSDFVPLPAERGAGAMVRLGRELHYFGGTGLVREESKTDHWILNLDAAQPQWVASAPLVNARNHIGGVAVVSEGKIFAVGGQHGHNDGLVTQAEVNVWDPANPGVWSTAAPLPKALSHITGATLDRNGRIVVVGGEIAHGSSVADVYEYNPATNTWRSLTPLPKATHSGVAAIIGNAIYYTNGNIGSSVLVDTTFKGLLG